MVHSTQLVVYSLEFCPNCDSLKEYLKSMNISYTERDLSTAESLTELRINGVFVQEAPVLQRGSSFLTSADLFQAGSLRKDQVQNLIEGS
ncbi:MAG: glutaredoxin family protein [Methanolinea sp.]|nr:glutaredoxin family protein [Methanolinea sp.]